MNKLKFLSVTIIIVMAAIFAAPRLQTAQAAPPLNDDFYGATVVVSLPFEDTLDTTEATTEMIDGADPWPCGYYPNKSVWYSYTPTASGSVQISTAGSNYNAVVGVFTGDYSMLGLVSCSADNSLLTTFLSAGTTYSILVVDGGNPYTPPDHFGGALHISITEPSGPENDDFANAKIITTMPYLDTVDNTFASAEPGEPPSNCAYYGTPYYSVWYSYTPQENGMLVGYASASFNNFISIYTGSSYADLTPVTCTYYGNSISSNVTPGTTYYIQIGSLYDWSYGTVTLNLDFVPPPSNDDFDNAKQISDLPYSDTMDTSYATWASDDPTECLHNSGSVWYAYTPPNNVVIEANTIGSYYDTTLAVYSGSRGALSLVPGCCNDDHYGLQSYVSFPATAGTTYYFLVGRCCGSGGSGGGYLVFNLLSFLPPENDDFSNATIIDQLPFTYEGDNQYTTLQPQEPTPSCDPWGELTRTVWFKYIPDRDGSLLFRTSGFYYMFSAAYQGSSLSQLQETACKIFSYNPQMVNVQAGKTYYFQVGSMVSWDYGYYQFQLEWTPPPSAWFDYYPSAPNTFDQVQFCDSSYDPAGMGLSSFDWEFGDGSTAAGYCAYHTFAIDGSYSVQHSATTTDGRTGSITRTILVRTHDVAITKFLTPQAASPGQTRQITVGIRNNRYPEEVVVHLLKGTPYGFQTIATQSLTVPVYKGNRTTDVNFDYTFTEQDSIPGKVSFKAVVYLNYYTGDALPADNEAIGKPTKINPSNKPAPYYSAVVNSPDVKSASATFGLLGVGLAFGFLLTVSRTTKWRGRKGS